MKTFTCPYEVAKWVKSYTDDELLQEMMMWRIVRSKKDGVYYYYPVK